MGARGGDRSLELIGFYAEFKTKPHIHVNSIHICKTESEGRKTGMCH